MKRSIQIFADDHGAPPECLNGTIVKKNLANFQKEYAKLKSASPHISDDEAAVQAIKDISFGRERVKLGYSDIKVNASGKTNVVVDGEELDDVPARVKITAKRSDRGSNDSKA